MKAYYQTIIHLISCNFVTNPVGQIFGIHNQIFCFVYFGYTYFGGWIVHALLREIYIAYIYFIALRSLSNHSRCYVVTSSLVLLETETRYEFSRSCAYAYGLIIWPMNLWNLWKDKLFFIGNEHSINLASVVPWRLLFDLVC
jgi:hypothetical protein